MMSKSEVQDLIRAVNNLTEAVHRIERVQDDLRDDVVRIENKLDRISVRPAPASARKPAKKATKKAAKKVAKKASKPRPTAAEVRARISGK